MKKIGIITYDHNHLKTEQILLRFAGKYDCAVYALPFRSYQRRNVLFAHRPDQELAAYPGEVCEKLGFPFIPVEKDSDIPNECELFIIAGAGILSADCLNGKKVINCHPGVIPAARGLDAFKWSIYRKIPIGITLHFADEAVDLGEIISITSTPVFSSDTLESLARRHYETEIDVLCQFEQHLQHRTNPFQGITQMESTRRMKREIEEELYLKFQEYKEAFSGELLT